MNALPVPSQVNTNRGYGWYWAYSRRIFNTCHEVRLLDSEDATNKKHLLALKYASHELNDLQAETAQLILGWINTITHDRKSGDVRAVSQISHKLDEMEVRIQAWNELTVEY